MKAVYRVNTEGSLSLCEVQSASISHHGDVILNQHANKNATTFYSKAISLSVSHDYATVTNSHRTIPFQWLFARWTSVSCFLLGFSSTWSGREPVGTSGIICSQAECLFCHPTISVKSLKETQMSHCTLASSIATFLREVLYLYFNIRNIHYVTKTREICVQRYCVFRICKKNEHQKSFPKIHHYRHSMTHREIKTSKCNILMSLNEDSDSNLTVL